ncbi:MAG: hypothetical protein E7122_05715 [Bacteroidales bacterium]|nr:hypothetical protein [Bacteroidales bacterium]
MSTQVTCNVLVSERTAKIIKIEAKLVALSVEVADIVKELYPANKEKEDYYTNSFGEALDCIKMLRDRSITIAIEDIGIVGESNKKIII